MFQNLIAHDDIDAVVSPREAFRFQIDLSDVNTAGPRPQRHVGENFDSSRLGMHGGGVFKGICPIPTADIEEAAATRHDPAKLLFYLSVYSRQYF
jgi:hypothetical protein